MDEIERLVASYGGVVSAGQLVNAGMSRQAIRTSSTLQRIRNGWYAVGAADPAVRSAVKNRGALACVTVLRRSGVWTPPDTRTHIRYSDHARRSRNCHPYGERLPILASIDSLDVALSSAMGCLDAEAAVVVFDSMLNKKFIDSAGVRTIAQSSRYRALNLADRCDEGSESGIETLTRLRLHAKGIKVTSQVWIGDIGRVDFLIGKRLILECDGQEYHGDMFESDRERDRRLLALGYSVVRLTYQQVMFDWDAAFNDILAVIRRREHLRAPKMGVAQRSNDDY